VKWVTPREAARILGVGVQTLANWRSRDRAEKRQPGNYYAGLTYKRYGSCVRYRLDEAILGPEAR
jgi:hypothetical protein